jgi:hypothetical protein
MLIVIRLLYALAMFASLGIVAHGTDAVSVIVGYVLAVIFFGALGATFSRPRGKLTRDANAALVEDALRARQSVWR